ncbi:hypothetical protein HYY69_05355 [Candidatus Woesearchaeota archaeon]|nr:hypothetical protein [Candidatus Woesearchaeota archaeon]
MVLDDIVSAIRNWYGAGKIARVMEATTLAAAPVTAYAVDTQSARAEPPAGCHDQEKCREYDTSEHLTVEVGRGKPLPPPDTSGNEPILALYALIGGDFKNYEDVRTGNLESSRAGMGWAFGAGADLRLVTSYLLTQVGLYYLYKSVHVNISPEGKDGGESGSLEGTEHNLGAKLRFVPGWNGNVFTGPFLFEGNARFSFRDYSGSKINSDTGDSFPEEKSATNYSLDAVLGGYFGINFSGELGRGDYLGLLIGWSPKMWYFDNTKASTLDGMKFGARLRLNPVLFEAVAGLYGLRGLDNIDASYGDGVSVKPTGLLYDVDAKLTLELLQGDKGCLYVLAFYRGNNHNFKPEAGSQAERNWTNHEVGVGVGGCVK